MGDDFDDIPATGAGLMPPTAAQLPGRLLAVEVKQQRIIELVRAQRRMALWLVGTVVGGSLGVMLTVIGAAIYVGGRFQAIVELDRRVTRIEDGATITSGGHR